VSNGVVDSPAGLPEETRAPESAEARVGLVVDDKYTLVRLIGRGGMGVVYEARHAKLARRFAIKFLLPELAANREVLRRFENEAKAAGCLEHPNLVAVTDVGSSQEGAPYLVMEFLQGEDCAHMLRRMGPLPVQRATNIVVQACRGLAIAHQAGIVHRDLKPENLFVTDAGDGSDLAKVLDFGIAKLRATETTLATGSGATFGTAFYMSPEQARGSADVDQRTDVWSLGVVLYELLGGRKPFEGEQFLYVIQEIVNATPPSLQTIRPALPPKLVAAVERAMSRPLADRWPTVAAFAEAIAPFAGTLAHVSEQPALAATSLIVGASPVMSKTMRLEEPMPAGEAHPPERAARPEPPRHRSFRTSVLAGGTLAVTAALALGVWVATSKPRPRHGEAQDSTRPTQGLPAPVATPPPPREQPALPPPSARSESPERAAEPPRPAETEIARPSRPKRHPAPLQSVRKPSPARPAATDGTGSAPPPTAAPAASEKKPKPAMVF
jgi:serine/threonine protein kinase